MYDIIVIGGGAAGLIAAGRAAEVFATGTRKRSVLLLEKMEKPARKIRITGKGRCNLTNTHPISTFNQCVHSGEEFARAMEGESLCAAISQINALYSKSEQLEEQEPQLDEQQQENNPAMDFLYPSLRVFDNHTTMRFFSNLKLDLIVERGGRVFPSSGKAWDVANVLEYWARDLGVEFRCHSAVQEIAVEEGRVAGVVLSDGERIDARAVIIATGGATYPRTGSTGDGYTLAHQASHSIIPITPALIPLEISEDIEYYRGLTLRNVNTKLIVDGNQVAERFGEAEFTDKALAGATVLKLSRYVVEAIIAGAGVEIAFDLKPALNPKKLNFRINRDIAELDGETPFSVLLDRLLPRELHSKVAREIDINSREYLSNITKEQIELLVEKLKDLRFKIVDYRPFEEAIVTSGGVKLSEVNSKTLGSNLVRGLYFGGEVLDVDADTGGYNIQIALSTGRMAGQSAAEAIVKLQL